MTTRQAESIRRKLEHAEKISSHDGFMRGFFEAGQADRLFCDSYIKARTAGCKEQAHEPRFLDRHFQIYRHGGHEGVDEDVSASPPRP